MFKFSAKINLAKLLLYAIFCRCFLYNSEIMKRFQRKIYRGGFQISYLFGIRITLGALC